MMPVPVRRRSLAAPLLLILIGVLFLLHTMNLIDRAALHHWFAHWWPALLIFWGVVRLVEYYNDQRSGYPARRMGGGATFLLIMLIIVGISSTKTENWNWGAMNGNIDFDDPSDWSNLFGGQTYTFNNTVEQQLPSGATLRVLNDYGDVTVNVWDNNQIKVDAGKKIHAEENSDSGKLDNSTKPTISIEGNTVTVNANTSGAGNNVGVRSDLQIWVPGNVPVDVATRKGDVTVRQRNANVKASDSKGSITVEDVKGNVELDERGKGDIHVARIDGTVMANGQVDDSSISDVSGDVKLTGDYYGDMQLSKLAHGFSFHSSRTELDIAKLDGDLDMNPGDLRASNIAGPVRVLTKSTDIHLDGISGQLQVENTNGNIEVHSSKLGPIDISNETGDVHVVVPDKAGFQADIHTRNGDISSSDFGSLRTQSENGESRATGSVGSGGPTVKVNSQHGDIELRKSGSSEDNG
jgi:DUF4097 and DUF4098 domain-containing protein YvlB